MSIPPLGEGESAVWRFSSHSPAILAASMYFGGEIPRRSTVGRATVGTGVILLSQCVGGEYELNIWPKPSCTGFVEWEEKPRSTSALELFRRVNVQYERARDITSLRLGKKAKSDGVAELVSSDAACPGSGRSSIRRQAPQHRHRLGPGFSRKSITCRSFDRWWVVVQKLVSSGKPRQARQFPRQLRAW